MQKSKLYTHLKRWSELLLLLISLSWIGFACHYPETEISEEGLTDHARDSLEYLKKYHYTFGTNLEVYTDSVHLAGFPIEGEYYVLHENDRVVVADFARHPNDGADSIWVKLAHSQEVQGWVKASELKRDFVPTDSISQFIHLFSDTHFPYFLGVFFLFFGLWSFRLIRRMRLNIVFFNDIASPYPAILCFLMALSATLYESMQVFAPDLWEQYYFTPTLSPMKVPLLLSLFLGSIWLMLIFTIASIDDVVRKLPSLDAFFYLTGLLSCCIFCYMFFVLTTHLYIGYLFLLIFFIYLLKFLKQRDHSPKYRCGNCGQFIEEEGRCPHCGAYNLH